jgi:hypothetical protein
VSDKSGLVASTYYEKFDELHAIDREALFSVFDYIKQNREEDSLIDDDPLISILNAVSSDPPLLIPSSLFDPFFLKLYF